MFVFVVVLVVFSVQKKNELVLITLTSKKVRSIGVALDGHVVM